MDCFLYDRELRHERVNQVAGLQFFSKTPVGKCFWMFFIPVKALLSEWDLQLYMKLRDTKSLVEKIKISRTSYTLLTLNVSMK